MFAYSIAAVAMKNATTSAPPAQSERFDFHRNFGEAAELLM
jgi:hypothetical protein